MRTATLPIRPGHRASFAILITVVALTVLVARQSLEVMPTDSIPTGQGET